MIVLQSAAEVVEFVGRKEMEIVEVNGQYKVYSKDAHVANITPKAWKELMEEAIDE